MSSDSLYGIRATRASPPGHARDDEERRRVYGSAALAQFDELITAASVVGSALRPLPLFYALSQAGLLASGPVVGLYAGRRVIASTRRPYGSATDAQGSPCKRRQVTQYGQGASSRARRRDSRKASGAQARGTRATRAEAQASAMNANRRGPGPLEEPA